MKQKALIGFLGVALVALVMYSCKKKDALTIPGAASEIAYADNSPKSFYVLATSPGDTYKIPVGITTPLTRAVTVNLSYSSATAVAGTHYTGPSSITIPAGKVLDSISLKGIFANIPVGVAHKVVVKVSGGDLPALLGKDSVEVTLRRYCTVNVANIAGTYNVTETSQYYGVSTYQQTITGVTQTSATTATATINNLWNSGITATTVFDWTDPANFKVNMNPAAQTTAFTSAGMAVLITQTGTPQTFSSCSNTVTMNFRLYRTDNALFDIWKADMVRQ